MCEITNGKIYVADRDMVCYKVMLENGEQLASFHHGYEYKIGREYCVKAFDYRCLTDDAIYEAWNKPLSSFAGWRKIYTVYPYMYMNRIETDLHYTHCGFYSYTYYGNESMKMLWPFYELYDGLHRVRCVRCRIPEGSKYMVSDNGEVFISERIVIDDAWSLEDSDSIVNKNIESIEKNFGFI